MRLFTEDRDSLKRWTDYKQTRRRATSVDRAIELLLTMARDKKWIVLSFEAWTLIYDRGCGTDGSGKPTVRCLSGCMSKASSQR
jgi:hypothetical protein